MRWLKPDLGLFFIPLLSQCIVLTLGLYEKSGQEESFSESCQGALLHSRIELDGDFAVLYVDALGATSIETRFQHPVQALYTCGWLASAVRKNLVITATSNVAAAKASLRGLAQQHHVVILSISPWPGNTAKIVVFAGLLRALVRIGEFRQSQDPEGINVNVLLTDCCDVLYRHDGSCQGTGDAGSGGDLFSRFKHLFAKHGHDIVFSAERGTSMVVSRTDYLARLHAAQPTIARKPPKGWLLPVWRHRSRAPKGARRLRVFSHSPAELPPSPLLNNLGTPDVCTAVDGDCIHHKSVNSGLVVGELGPLANLYGELLRICKDDCSIFTSSPGAAAEKSDQNIVAHYLLASHFCGGRCSLDYNFSLFHTVPVWGSGDYRAERDISKNSAHSHSPPPRLSIRLPVAKASYWHAGRGNQERTVQVADDWIALSPSAYKLAWFPLAACAFHAPRFADTSNPASNLEIIRSSLGLQTTSFSPFSLLAGASNKHVSLEVDRKGIAHPILMRSE